MKLAVKQNVQDKTFSLDALLKSSKYKHWIEDNRVVMIHDIYHDSALDSATYIVITKDIPVKNRETLYSIHRFFNIGESVHVSVDHEGKTSEEIFELLVSKKYSRGTY